MKVFKLIINWILEKLFRFLEWVLSLGNSNIVNIQWSIEDPFGNILYFQGEFKMNLNTEQRVKVTVRPTTEGGNPAKIDGVVSFNSSNPEVARVEVIDDKNAYIYGVSTGSVVISASFDADLDLDEVRTLVYDGEITVVEAEAESATLEYAPVELVLTSTGQPPIEIPVGETPVEETPVEETPVEDSPEENPADDAGETETP